MSCDLSPKNLLIASNSDYKNRFFRLANGGLLKPNFDVSIAEGAGNIKIGFIVGGAIIQQFLDLANFYL